MENTTIETKKISENEIEVKKTIVVEPQITTQVYSYEYLMSQKETIQAQKDRDNAARDAELAEVDKLLSECVKLEIKEKVVEQPVEPVAPADTISSDVPAEKLPDSPKIQ